MQVFPLLLMKVIAHVEKKAVFCGQLIVASDVVDHLLEPMLADQVEIDAVGAGFPLEIVEAVKLVLRFLPSGKPMSITGLLTAATFQEHAPYQL